MNKFIKKLDIYNPNKHMQTPRETFEIGVAEIITGLISVLSLGRYGSGLAANTISKIVIKCIHKRQAKSENESRRY